MKMRGMTLEEVLANPNMNAPLSWPMFVQSVAVVLAPVPLIEQQTLREIEPEERAAFIRFVDRRRPGSFEDWGLVYHEEITRDVVVPPNIRQSMLRDLNVLERLDGWGMNVTAKERETERAFWRRLRRKR